MLTNKHYFKPEVFFFNVLLLTYHFPKYCTHLSKADFSLRWFGFSIFGRLKLNKKRVNFTLSVLEVFSITDSVLLCLVLCAVVSHELL